MIISAPELTEFDKIRQQFDYGPYPRIPIDRSPKTEHQTLYFHNLVTPYYLKYRRVIDTKDTVILDAGCGSGYNALVLATANPGAKIVGIDISEESVKLAQQRLHHHGFHDAEFHVLPIENIAELGMAFDYINCDEMLYLLPNPAEGLQWMKAVLKPEGLIRTNLHNVYQRESYYRAQALFKLMGLMNESPKELEEEVVTDTMNALKDEVRLKKQTWKSKEEIPGSPEKFKEFLAMNLLFVGDKGFTIPETFTMLRAANLEFVSMVNWRQWDIVELFKDADDLPAFWSMSLAEASAEEKLHAFELLHPVHRLIDFWCAHSAADGTPVDDWDDSDWQQTIVHLHPQLCTDTLKAELIRCIKTGEAFEISREVKLPTLAPVFLEPSQAACLLPLWDGSQPIQALAERYQKVRSIDPETLEPLTAAAAFAAVKDILNRMDAFLYVLLETRAACRGDR
jgi:2-polyprenyl-3-methyl-5-hydroxy-6-metoxy-1,4-benzoquinol methylase